MYVRMRQYLSGTRDGVDWPAPGGVLNVPDAEGAELCRTGVAEPVTAPPAVQRAVTPTPDKRAAGTR